MSPISDVSEQQMSSEWKSALNCRCSKVLSHVWNILPLFLELFHKTTQCATIQGLIPNKQHAGLVFVVQRENFNTKGFGTLEPLKYVLHNALDFLVAFYQTDLCKYCHFVNISHRHAFRKVS